MTVARAPIDAAPFPILDRSRFDAHPKSRKPRDRARILYSKNSEDWVTWTVFGLLERCAPTTWWHRLVRLARIENPALAVPDGWEEVPTPILWSSVPSPLDYERNSRKRMLSSDDRAWKDRCDDPRPVEGPSEIDITLGNGVLLVVAEAKLSSDISLRTKYDPDRDQIVRNIDCAIETAAGRVPMFWMIVCDDRPDRLYGRLLRDYRNRPQALAVRLSHRDPKAVTRVARNLALILWRDLTAEVGYPHPEDNSELAAIKRELARRCL